MRSQVRGLGTFLVLVDGKFLELILAQAAPPSPVTILDKLGDLGIGGRKKDVTMLLRSVHLKQ